MRFRAPLFVLLFAVGLFALPLAAHAQGIPFFGPIIPEAVNQCAASWGMLMTVVNNIIRLLITLAIVFVAPLTIAYAGFLYVVNPVDPSGIAKAKGVLTNTVVGIVIALAGWMIVDAIMAVLYQPANPGQAWSQIISGNSADLCIPLKGSLNHAQTTGVSATGALRARIPGTTGAACDPAAVKAAAETGGIPLTPMQANIFACLAKWESTCGADNLNYSWDKPNKDGKASTAAGAFQVLLSSNHSCYENKACQQAAGVSGALNCQKGFGANGFTAGGNSTVLAYCTKAAADLNCSASAAACLLNQNGGSFSPWQADKNSAKQTACITSGG